MSDGPHSPAAIALAYTDAVNRRAHAEAAELLAEDVELIFPGGRLIGRQAWLESRARQQPGELTEEVATDGVAETDNGAELTGRLVQRWAESGDVASELPVRIAITVADGAITRLELVPLAGS
jgi:ketosteroid isomerase-like protein